VFLCAFVVKITAPWKTILTKGAIFMSRIRIQKLLSDAGVTSRKGVEPLILDGRITVNGEPVAQLPCFVDPDKDEILLDGRPVKKFDAKPVYILVNKPRGVVSTEHPGPAGEPRVVDIVPPHKSRVFVVGALDDESTGVVLVTNDGELAQRMTHARFGLVKKYVADVEGRMGEEALEALKAGMFFDGRRTRRAYVKVLSRSPERTLLEIDVAETHNRQVRRMFAKVGHKVRRLKRVALGPLTDDGIKIGHWRNLLPGEVRRLHAGDTGGMPENEPAKLPGGKAGAGTSGGKSGPGGKLGLGNKSGLGKPSVGAPAAARFGAKPTRGGTATLGKPAPRGHREIRVRRGEAKQPPSGKRRDGI